MSAALSFGLVSDSQYCDTDDGAQFGDPDRVRRYRLVLQKLQNAVVHFESADVSFCVLLGDVIDGKCKKLGQTSADYETLINLITDNSTKEWYFNVGNHDFYNFSRQEIYESHFYIPASSKAVCNANKLYYDTCPAPGFRFVWLDPFEISTFSAVNDDSTKLANETLFKMNPNIRDGNINWLENLSEDVRQYVPYNGACGDEQMLWFKEVLSKSEATKEKVFVFCHTPIHRKCCRLSARAWNSDELLKVIQDSCAVQAFFSGHDHDGGYSCDEVGIHHVVPAALLECGELEDAYGVVKCYEHHFQIDWTGKKPPEARYGIFPHGIKLKYR